MEKSETNVFVRFHSRILFLPFAMCGRERMLQRVEAMYRFQYNGAGIEAHREEKSRCASHTVGILLILHSFFF